MVRKKDRSIARSDILFMSRGGEEREEEGQELLPE